MTPENFAYWLQGFSEISNSAPTPEQWKIIQAHLALVMTKVTPDLNPSPTPGMWKNLNDMLQNGRSPGVVPSPNVITC